jgi:hypothetical protein
MKYFSYWITFIFDLNAFIGEHIFEPSPKSTGTRMKFVNKTEAHLRQNVAQAQNKVS